MDHDATTRARLEEHWTASERGDIDTEHAIYAEDAVLDYPQSGSASRAARRSRRNAAGIRPSATSPFGGSWAAGPVGERVRDQL
jgi:hypothetical protein